MGIEYENEKVNIGMKKHIRKGLDDITRDAASPARPDLFNTPESKALNN